jgi:wyosine [tRNA(Phe)-imidazoG37] synthetase (radical SAM superfamily)
MKTIYGPVASWRLGKSLGIDLICSPQKICSFNCQYCQLEQTKQITTHRQTFVSLKKIQTELNSVLPNVSADIITLSGTGEPTLAANMADVIDMIRYETDIPIGILTNSTLLYKPEVRNTLQKIDVIVAKLDAPHKAVFEKINRPAPSVSFEQTLEGIHQMHNDFSGKFALQIMFIHDNKDMGAALAALARDIEPDEVQINTPLRPCPVAPLPQQVLEEIEHHFTGLPTTMVYTSKRPHTNPLDKLELFKRRRMET